MLSHQQFGDLAQHVSQPGEGATVDIKTGERKSSGWAVAEPGHEHVEPAETFGPHTLHSFVQQHSEVLSQPGRHLGLWHDPASKQVYLDVSKIHPETYGGGAHALSEAYRGPEGLQGPGHQEVSVYRIGSGHTLYTHPETSGQHKETRQAMAGLRKQQPKAKRVSNMPTKELGAALRNRKPV